MAINIDLTATRLVKISLTLRPAAEMTQDIVTDGDGGQLLDGDGNPVFGWIEE